VGQCFVYRKGSPITVGGKKRFIDDDVGCVWQFFATWIEKRRQARVRGHARILGSSGGGRESGNSIKVGAKKNGSRKGNACWLRKLDPGLSLTAVI